MLYFDAATCEKPKGFGALLPQAPSESRRKLAGVSGLLSANTAAYVLYHTPRYCIITVILPAGVSIRVFLTLHRQITAMRLQYTLNHVAILLYSCCLTVAGSIYSHCTAILSQRRRLGTYSSSREASRHLLAVPPSSILHICIYSGCESCSQSTGTIMVRGCYR